MMKEKKVWFKGLSRQLWVPVSVEGGLVTASFFIGVLVIGRINNVSDNTSLSLSQVLPIVVEFACLLAGLYFVTKDHVDKRY